MNFSAQKAPCWIFASRSLRFVFAARPDPQEISQRGGNGISASTDQAFRRVFLTVPGKFSARPKTPKTLSEGALFCRTAPENPPGFEKRGPAGNCKTGPEFSGNVNEGKRSVLAI